MHLLFELLSELRTTKNISKFENLTAQIRFQQLITTPSTLHSIAEQSTFISDINCI